MLYNPNRCLLTVLAIVVCISQFSATIAAQTSSPQQPEAKPLGFRLAGKVVSAIDGHPLAQAHILLVNTKSPQNPPWIASSEDGHFEFNQVAKGKYSLEGAKRGFISQAYNQHEQYSTAIVTGADVPTEDLVLRLMPMAVISVKIIDESGEPVRKAMVMLYREDRRSGVRRILGFKSGSTDDLGSCEFTRLNAGTYFVAVTAAPWYAMHPASVSAGGLAESSSNQIHSFDVVYPPTYYGDTSEPDSAVPIVIKGGDQAQAEIHLSPVQSLHLVFSSAENGQRGATMPTLQRLGFDGTGIPQMAETRQVSPGLFEITGIAPGRYKVSVPGSAPGEMDISTSGQDLSAIKGEALSMVKASVQIFGEAKLPQRLYLQLLNGDEKIAASQMVNEKGEVTFANVNPGQYNIFAATYENKNYSVVKVSSAESETSGRSLNVPSGSPLTVSISLAGGMVNVEGFAKRDGKGEAGAMVVLVPKNPESNRELFRRDQSDLDGSFNLQGIAQGSYTVVAIEDGWNLDWSLPSVIEPYLKKGKTVTITDQHGQSVQLPEAVEVQPHP
jgi:hypothetical protein